MGGLLFLKIDLFVCMEVIFSPPFYQNKDENVQRYEVRGEKVKLLEDKRSKMYF